MSRKIIVDGALTNFSDKTKLRLARDWADKESIENEAKDKDKLPPPGGGEEKEEEGRKKRGREGKIGGEKRKRKFEPARKRKQKRKKKRQGSNGQGKGKNTGNDKRQNTEKTAETALSRMARSDARPGKAIRQRAIFSARGAPQAGFPERWLRLDG